MRVKLLKSFIFGVLTMEGISYAADPNQECRVAFKFDSDKVMAKSLDACVEKLRLQAASQETLDIVGSATPEGTTAYNDALSKRRAENLKAALLEKMPSLKVEALGIGEIPRHGLIARIVVDAAEEAGDFAQETINRKELTASVGMSDVSSSKMTVPESRDRWRVGPRLGQDRTRIENEDNYFAPGLDIAYIPSTGVANLRVEIGAIGNIYMDGEEQEMSSVHFAPMLAYQSLGGFIAGVRGLAGVVNSDISDDSIDDGGAELRIGRETRDWSAFIGAGQTKVLDRIGLDIGFRF